MDAKPAKPYPDFPLFPHATKRWAKKIRGKLHYFGPWSDPDAALLKYLDQRDDLQAGRVPRLTPADTRGFTMRELVNRFLTSKNLKAENGEMSRRMFNDYHGICERLVEAFGRDRLVTDIRSEDFEQLRAKLASGVGPVTLSNLIRRSRAVFKFAYDADLIEHPLKMGPGFKPPSKKALRADRQSKPLRLFDPADLRKVIGAAGPAMKAMALLGVNCGFGNTDCAKLPRSAVNLEAGWITFPRPKTAIVRRCSLWPETVAAIRESIDRRPKAKRPEFDGLVFLTKYGLPFVRESSTGGHIDSLSTEFTKLTTKLGINRKNLTFYALRHTTETIGGDARDQPAVDYIMGHVAAGHDMSAVYRERIDDKRLKAVADHVHDWLFPQKKTATKKRASGRKGVSE